MRELTDEQWKAIEVDIPTSAMSGRPRASSRDTLEGILCWMRTGLWPRQMGGPSEHTCRRRMREWVDSGVFVAVVETLQTDLLERGQRHRLWADSWEWRTVTFLLSPRLARELTVGGTPVVSSPAASAASFLVAAITQRHVT
jgi:transposase